MTEAFSCGFLQLVCPPFLRGLPQYSQSAGSKRRLDAEQINFSVDCFRYGFKPADYRRHFEYSGVEYEFVGFDTSAKKYNCIVKDIKTGIVSKVNSLMLKEILK